MHTFGDFNFMRKLLLPSTKESFDISCVHGRYSREVLLENLGGEATFITIIREPVKQFVSFWIFYKLEKELKMDLNSWILR